MRTLSSLVLACCFTAACATAQEHGDFPRKPMMASLGPVEPSDPPEPHRIDLEAEKAPGLLLERGLEHFSADENNTASKAFRAAIKTGRLNDAGRALAYWHIYLADKRHGNIDGSSNALSSFVVVAEDILAKREHVRYAVSASGDFVDRFNVPTKLELGRAILSARWAERTDGFGRNVQQPIPVHTDGELQFFLDAVAPCDGGSGRSVNRREVSTSSGQRLQHVTLTCGVDARESVDYYFDMHE